MSADWACLSALLPGETVYSWCGAQHAFRAGKSAFETSHGLLGYGHGPRQHDLPAGLSKLPIFQAPYSLSIEGVLKQHTIGGYYWPWLSKHARTQVLQDCAEGNSPHWRRALFATSRSRPFQHALRWCPECAEADLAQDGRAYWHVEHQSPIARACRNHRKLLQAIPLSRKTWALVPDAVSAPTTVAPRPALMLAQLSAAICSMASINVNGLRGAVLLRLQEAGVTASTRGVLHETLEKWFSSTDVATWCHTDGHGLAQLAHGEWIAGMLWRQRRSHPVLWPVLWAALEWSSPDEATMAFEDAASGRVRLAGGQITLFDEHADIPTSAPEHVRSAFMRANSYQDVMQQLGVSRGRIIQWLEMDPELRGAWKAQLRAGHQAQCEQAIRDTVLEGNVVTRAELEAMCPAEVRWMREHAPAKLAAMLRSMPARLAVQPTLFEGGGIPRHMNTPSTQPERRRPMDQYTYRVTWSPEDQCHVALCDELPSLSWLAATPEEAFKGIRRLVAECAREMAERGEVPPSPIPHSKITDRLLISVSPHVHRRLVMTAAEEGTNLDDVVSGLLSDRS